MDMSFEDQIRERAYQIWQAGGMADGQAHEHWVSAEQAVRGEVAATEPEVILTKAAPRKVAAKKAPSTKTVAAKAAAVSKAPRAKAKKVVEATAH